MITNTIKWETTKKNLVNNVYENKTQSELGSFLHATCFIPVKSTFIEDVNNGNLSIWPGLTEELIAAHLPKSEATFLGHLDQIIETPDPQKVSK